MLNFTFYNPTKIVFGKGQISQLAELVPEGKKVMMTYGGGSIKKNGVYEQVQAALKKHDVVEFGGIQPNPAYENLMEAVKKARTEKVDFLLAVGGGSVVDATKFIAAAVEYEGKDPWDIPFKQVEVKKALPLGCVLTLPATGSEMNRNAVISKKDVNQKYAFYSEKVFPVFSILDPETTFSLPRRQVSNGIVDTFVHVTEQYLTYDANTPLQDRFAEGILKTLIEEAPKVGKDSKDYDVRANLMWCSTMALNHLIGCGAPSDFATHLIGHELTALYGIDHARTLAIVWPAVMKHQKERKLKKLCQYAERVWGISGREPHLEADEAIEKTVEFFKSLGLGVTFGDYDVPAEACRKVAEKIDERGRKLGEHADITGKDVEEILGLCV